MKAFAITALLILLASPGSSAERLDVRLSRRIAMEPGALQITVKTVPNADDRALVVELDSERLYRSSTVQLEGDREPPTHVYSFDRLPAGEYVVTVWLVSVNARRVARQDFQVVGNAER